MILLRETKKSSHFIHETDNDTMKYMHCIMDNNKQTKTAKEINAWKQLMSQFW